MSKNDKGLEIYEEMKKWAAIWHVEADKFYTGNKLAGQRARKAIDRMHKLRIQWKRETLAK